MITRDGVQRSGKSLVEAAHPFEVDQREMESRGSAIDFGRSASLFPWHRDFTSAARPHEAQSLSRGHPALSRY